MTSKIGNKGFIIFVFTFTCFLLPIQSPAFADYASGTFQNIYVDFMRDPSEENICDPAHSMTENVLTDGSGISSDGLTVEIAPNALRYTAYTDYIPTESLKSYMDLRYVDYTYRGKMVLFGEEYYVRNITADTLQACRGVERTDVLETGYSGNYRGYTFKAFRVVFGCGSGACGMEGGVIYVMAPDSTVTEVEATILANGRVDDLEISITKISYTSDDKLNFTFIVYDRGTQVSFRDGEEIDMGDGLTYDWVAHVGVESQPFSTGMDISCYDDIQNDQEVLSNVSITYSKSARLTAGESLALPAGYIISSDGLMLHTETNTCTLSGDYYPCGEVTLLEITRMVREWAAGDAQVTDVAELIGEWASN